MVGYAGSATRTAYVDVTLTRSKVKVKVTGLLNFRQLAKLCMLAVMTAAPLRGILVIVRGQSLPTFTLPVDICVIYHEFTSSPKRVDSGLHHS